MRYYITAIALSFVAVSATLADEPDKKGVGFFESRIRPVLVKNCYGCHSTKAGVAKSGLRLDSRDAIRAGGERGPAVVPKNPKASWLLKAITHTDADLKMPPKNRLPDAVIADLKKWIVMGAPDPRESKTNDANKKPYVRATASFWAYQVPKNPPLPPTQNKKWAKKHSDNFILRKLEDSKLRPSADAQPHVLLRRLYFDLIGLPPSVEQISTFERSIKSDGIDTAFAGEVDKLLASPRFGEKWGRHWLDVARFGESSGGEANISFPYAWRYRDFVIDCFNADMPFNRFLVEQIAGDLLPFDNQRERARLLIATGFLAVGPKNLDEGNAKQFRADVVDEQIDAVSRAVMGMSVACARCHDHKFDPFSMTDYYALAGIFKSTKTFFGTAVSPSNRVGGVPLRLPDVDGQKIYHKSIPPMRVARLKAELAAMRKEQKDKKAAVFKAIKDGKDPSRIFTLRDALRIFWRSGAIEGQLEKVDENGNALPLAMGVLDADSIGNSPLYKRGDVSRPSAPVPRRFPEVLRFEGTQDINGKESGRLELARWLTNPKHPLTARVFVSRVWKHVFGDGLVRTVDNFGSTGELPSHSQLLDYLAVKFVNDGWSVKKLVRELVLSRTYRQSSTFRKDAFVADPDNRLLWRMPKRRLEAEAIRDAMLAVSGELDVTRPDASLVGRVIGDRPISLIGLDKRIPKDLDGSVHRSVFLPVIRDRLPDALELFDFAEPSLVTGHRETTNVPVQALYLMNSSFVQKRAAALAARLESKAENDKRRVDYAYLVCFGRTPNANERNRCLAFLSKGKNDEITLTSFCQALLCTAEFRNLD